MQTPFSQRLRRLEPFGRLLLPLLVFALVFALFAPSIRYPLVDLDDHAYITQNRIVLQGLTPDTVRRAFSTSNDTATMYMPMLWLSYMADVTFFHASPSNPAPFHAVNVTLHALSALLLYFLLRRLGAAPLWSALLTLLWAVHPLRVESVAWITERKDVLSAAFGLAATLAWLHSTPKSTAAKGQRPGGEDARVPPTSAPANKAPSPRGLPVADRVGETSGFPQLRRHPKPVAGDAKSATRRCLFLLLAALLYAIGLLAKPSLVPLPLAWLALDFWPLRRIPASLRTPAFFPSLLRAAAEKLLFLPLALAAAWLAVAQHHAVSGALSVPWSIRLVGVAPNFLFYLRKTLLPVGLSPLVPEQWLFPRSTLLLSLAVCAVLAAVVGIYRKSLPSLVPGAVWILLFFLPASGLQPLPMNTVADRFFYLPAIGLSIALAALLTRTNFRPVASASSGPLPEGAPGCKPGGGDARVPTAVDDANSGPLPEGAPGRRPGGGDVRVPISHCLLTLLLIPLAVLTFRLLPVWSSTPALYRHIADTFPGHPVAVSELANQAMRNRGDFDGAADLLRPALEKNPEHWFLRLSYANCLLQRESPDAAIDYIMTGHMPDDLYLSSQIFLTLANLELFRARFDEALRLAELSLSYTPDDSTVRSHALAIAVAAAFEAGDPDKALAYARQTRFIPNASSITLEHLLPLAVFNWTNAHRKQTLPLIYRILDAYPNRFDLWNNLLWGLATADWSPADPEEVLRRAFHLAEISPDPNHPALLDTLAVAQANAGHFDAALRLVDQALERVPDPGDSFRARLLHRRDLFQNRIPYRERAFDRLFAITFGAPSVAL